MVWKKDYRLNGYPPDGDRECVTISNAEYLDWLADYLYEAEVRLSPEQEYMFARMKGSPACNAMVGIGQDAGLHESMARFHPCYKFPPDFEKDFDVERAIPVDPDLSYEAECDDQMKEEISKEEYILDDYEWYVELREEKKEFCRYWPGFIFGHDAFRLFMRIDDTLWDGITEPVDAGWRSILSAILKKVPDKSERVHLLDRFYIGYLEFYNK